MFKLLSNTFKVKMLLLIIFLSVGNLLEIISIGAIPIFVANIIDQETPIFEIEYLNDFFSLISITQTGNLKGLIVIVAFIFFIKNILLISTVYFQLDIQKKLKIYLLNNIYRYYVNKEYFFFLSKTSESTIRTLTSDVEQSVNYCKAVINLIRDMLLLLFIFILLLSANIIITISIGSFFIIFVGLFLLFTKKKLKKSGALYFTKQESFIQLVNKTFYGIKEIKLFSKESFFLKIFKEKVKIMEDQRFISFFLNGIPRYILEFFGVLSILFVSFVFLHFDKNLSELIPILTLLVISILKLLPAFNGIATSFNLIVFNKKALNFVKKDLVDASKIRKVKNNSEYLDKNFNFNSLEFKKVNFGYLENQNILNNFSFQIKKGDKVGILGDSGSGKSTLLNVILGLLNKESGEILINGDEFYNNLKNWRHQIAYIPQEIFLFNDTLKTNIVYDIVSESVNTELLKKSIKESQLENFVKNQKNGLETIIGDRGSNISGGQKQRIAIARALYREPGVLVMDEPTSALDEYTEKKLIDEIFSIFKNKTIIFVSHKKELLENCNIHFKLNNGMLQVVNR